jgi:predicted AlkP superfamily pyrophosphatase or phosphodiesterase
LVKPPLLKFLAAVVLFLILFPLPGTKGKSDIPSSLARPKLIVMLVIDQFRYDYLVRFHPQFVEGGFKLLLSGANFVDCRYDYATTATGPGYTSIFTGAYPNIHGIIGNEWYDRSLHHAINCVGDPNTRLVGGGPESGASPRNLIGSTLGDELHFASDFRSKVVAVSLKDRAAVLPGGHTADAAYWYDLKTGHFVSSTYYTQALPSWATQFNEQSPAKAYCGKPWQALPETPGAGGKILKQLALAENEPCPDERFLGWINDTPFLTEIELRFAREAIRNERLGQGAETDLLSLALSENDYIGHAFGPYSPEVADTTLRTDRYLADFFKDLDRIVGLDNVWIALSADHGVAPNPAFIKKHRLGMGNAHIAKVTNAVEQALSQAFGQDRWVAFTDLFYIYLDEASLKRHQVKPQRAEALAAEAAASTPGVEAAFTRTQLLAGAVAGSPLARKVLNSFNSQRSGSVFLVLEPYAVAVEGEIGTTHGEPWNYDAQVPLVLWGGRFRPGIYTVPCQPIDIVPTLAAALGLTQPSGAEGQPLAQAVK